MPHGMTEFVTDMTTHRALMEAGFPRIIPGYTVMSLLGTGVVQEVADRQNVSPQTVENELTKELWTPATDGTDRLRSALGEVPVKALLHTAGNLSASATAYVAQSAGLRRAEAALWARDVGHPDGWKWFTWR